MLRVRPIHFTSRVEAFLPILELLGLAAGDSDADWYEFDAGSGRLALHRTEPGAANDGVTELGFEVRDLDVFAERTAQAGSTVEILELAHGRAARVRGADGVEFTVDRTEQPETDPAADPKLSVNMTWLTPDVAGAAADLRAIGARPENSSLDRGISNFSAKNGGRILVHQAAESAHGGLGFGYAGNLAELAARFAAAGIEAQLIDESYGRTLHLPNPDFSQLPDNPTGPTIWINEENQSDGYLDHRTGNTPE